MTAKGDKNPKANKRKRRSLLGDKGRRRRSMTPVESAPPRAGLPGSTPMPAYGSEHGVRAVPPVEVELEFEEDDDVIAPTPRSGSALSRAVTIPEMDPPTPPSPAHRAANTNGAAGVEPYETSSIYDNYEEESFDLLGGDLTPESTPRRDESDPMPQRDDTTSESPYDEDTSNLTHNIFDEEPTQPFFESTFDPDAPEFMADDLGAQGADDQPGSTGGSSMWILTIVGLLVMGLAGAAALAMVLTSRAPEPPPPPPAPVVAPAVIAPPLAEDTDTDASDTDEATAEDPAAEPEPPPVARTSLVVPEAPPEEAAPPPDTDPPVSTDEEVWGASGEEKVEEPEPESKKQRRRRKKDKRRSAD